MLVNLAAPATVVIPTRHEGKNVGMLLRRLLDSVGERPMCVLFVDDSDESGPDHTAEVVARVGPHIGGRLSVTCYHRTDEKRWGGLSGAVLDGIRQATTDNVVVMDGDLQHPPETVPELLACLESGRDVAVASRYREGGSNAGLDGLLRRGVSSGATILTRTLFPRRLRGVTDPMSGFFAVRRSALVMEHLENASGFKILFEILASHVHLRCGEVPMRFGVRNGGESKADAHNGREFLGQVPRLRVRSWPEWFNFTLVGGVTAAPAVALFWLLVRAGINPVAAHGMELVAASAANFNLNSRWTWPSRRYTWAQRRGFVAVRLLTMTISWWVFKELLVAGFHALAANAVGLTAGLAANYLFTRLVLDQRAQTRPRLRREGRHSTARPVRAT